jgi:membrane-associated HD superfamily phosphohydrolase
MIYSSNRQEKLMEDAGNMLLFSIAHLNLSRLSLIQDDVLVRNLRDGKLRSSSAEVSQLDLVKGKTYCKIWGFLYHYKFINYPCSLDCP